MNRTLDVIYREGVDWPLPSDMVTLVISYLVHPRIRKRTNEFQLALVADRIWKAIHDDISYLTFDANDVFPHRSLLKYEFARFGHNIRFKFNAVDMVWINV